LFFFSENQINKLKNSTSSFNKTIMLALHTTAAAQVLTVSYAIEVSIQREQENCRTWTYNYGFFSFI